MDGASKGDVEEMETNASEEEERDGPYHIVDVG